jgi:ferrous iron transport protein B
MTTFPGLSDDRAAQFETARREILGGTMPEAEKTARLAAILNEEAEAALQSSLAGRIGYAMEPLLRPMGFDWKIGTALIGAFAAKEVFVAQMGIIHSIGEADEESETLREKLKKNYTPLVGFCIMLFCLISAPCMVTIAVTRRESNSWGWALFQLGGLTLLAYGITVLVYQAGRFLGIGVV